MNCPHCSAVVVSSTGRCASCGRALPGHQVAAAVLTPPPTSPDSETGEITSLGDAATTQIGIGSPDSPDRSSFDDATTGFVIDPSKATPAAPRSATGPLVPGQPFGNRYNIIRVLGVGGMGAVYHAWDGELGETVALKVIRPEATSDPAAAREMERRFKQELVLARQVTHKNVVRIHDLGEINGIKYITMPYLAGSDLASTLKQQGRMPVPAALKIIRDIAAGLVAAHEAGIIHRDLKPANIMVLPDHAVIMDFGIARVASGIAPEAPRAPVAATDTPSWHTQVGSTSATVAGVVLGTVQYMAPEQAKGQADQRSDIYALGLIFSDMLIGKRHTSADESAFTELMRRMEAAPPPVRTADPAIPEAIENLIQRCLAPDPAGRFQTAAELVTELDRLDENGEPIPIKRVVRLPFVVAVVLLLLALSVGTWWYTSSLIPPAPHDPVSVIIADFSNATKDASFDRTLEPMLKLALEQAAFVSAYDRAVLRSALGAAPPDKLDEAAARGIAVNQGLGVVVSGTLEPRGAAYDVTLKAVQAVTGEVITTVNDRASGKDQVLAVVTQLAADVRSALGDETSDSAQRFAMESLSATSLDVIREYALAQQAMADSRFDEAHERFSRAAMLDPNFGYAYAALGMVSKNLNRQQEAEKYANEAVRHIDRMTERERLRTRGLIYTVTGDNEACVKEYSVLLEKYPADASARNNVALCSTYMRKVPRAVEEMQRVVQILPKRSLYRINLALYSAYAGDFLKAEREARTALELKSALGYLPLAFAQLGQGKAAEARQSYEQLTASPQGAAYVPSGLADLAVYEGRYADAIQIFRDGANADLAAQRTQRAAAKFVGLAYAQLSRNQRTAALVAAETALKHSDAIHIRFRAARVFVAGGAAQRARELAASLAAEAAAEPRAYAKIIDGEILLEGGKAREASQAFAEANTILDTWVGRFDLGRAYFADGKLLQADSEFDRCINGRGEIVSLALDEEPTFGLLPSVYYYQGRVREELKTAAFADSYKTYLSIRGQAGEDPLLLDVRRRAGD